MEENRRLSPLFFIIGVFFITSLLVSNLVAGKLISVFGMVLPAAVVLFPITYIFGDVLTEVYGFKHSRLIIWSGFACNMFMVIVFFFVLILPYPTFWNGQDAYETVLGITPRILIASLLGYLIGGFMNSVILSKLKLATNGRLLWLRTISSTIVGEGIDTLIFITVVFWGNVSNSVLMQMILLQYVWKVSYEILLTPLTYVFVRWLKFKEGIDTYDFGVKYNPFSFKIK
jgi:hypothetical protein